MTISPKELFDRVRKCLGSRCGKLAIAGSIGALLVGVMVWQSDATRADKRRRPASEQTAWHARAPWQAPYTTGENSVQLCQHVTPASPCPTPAVDCVNDCCNESRGWKHSLGPVPDFQQYSQGEYVGRARLPHVATYRLRVDDSLEFVFRVDRNR